MRVIYNKLTKEISQVVQDDNSITLFPDDYGVIQGDADTVEVLAVALGLDVSQIPGLNMSPEKAKVLTRIARCKETKLRFLTENSTITIAAEQGGAVLQNFSTLLLLLEVGDAKTALAVVSQMPAELFPVTPDYDTSAERKQSYVEELQNIVASLFE